MRPSYGSRAKWVKASTGPTPGIEVRRAERRARSASAAIVSVRRFSRRRISVSIRAKRRLARRRSMASSSCAAWFSIAREACALREQQHVEPVLRHVDSTEALLYHPRVPPLLMRARALATVREWKKRLEHQAHSRPCHRGGYGLPVATGTVS